MAFGSGPAGAVFNQGASRPKRQGERIFDAAVGVDGLIEEFHENVPEALAGHNVGLLLRGVDREQVVRGQVLIAPGSLREHRAVRAEIFLLTKQEGGRHTAFGGPATRRSSSSASPT